VTRFGISIADAVKADRIHCEGPAITLEPSFPADRADALRAMGHTIVRNGYTARLAAINVKPTGEIEGGTDPRGGGGLAVVE
jgi:gamma-glutamyltranspeptidase